MKTSVLVRIKEIYLPDTDPIPGGDGDGVVGDMPDFTGAGAEPDFTGATDSNPPESDPYDFR